MIFIFLQSQNSVNDTQVSVFWKAALSLLHILLTNTESSQQIFTKYFLFLTLSTLMSFRFFPSFSTTSFFSSLHLPLTLISSPGPPALYLWRPVILYPLVNFTIFEPSSPGTPSSPWVPSSSLAKSSPFVPFFNRSHLLPMSLSPFVRIPSLAYTSITHPSVKADTPHTTNLNASRKELSNFYHTPLISSLPFPHNRPNTHTTNHFTMHTVPPWPLFCSLYTHTPNLGTTHLIMFSMLDSYRPRLLHLHSAPFFPPHPIVARTLNINRHSLPNNFTPILHLKPPAGTPTPHPKVSGWPLHRELRGTDRKSDWDQSIS